VAKAGVFDRMMLIADQLCLSDIWLVKNLFRKTE